MKKEGIQTRNRKSSSKSGTTKSAVDDDASAWSMLERIPQPPSLPSPRSQLPHQFKTFPSSSSSSSDVHRPPLSNYCFDPAALGIEAPHYPDGSGAEGMYPVAYAHAQQVPGDYASIAAFGGASGFSVAAAAGYCL